MFPNQKSLAPVALRWILDFDEVSTVIPGASRLEQVASNLEASELAPISEDARKRIDEIYASDIRPLVHHLW